jgi:hypothetical protein
MRFTAKPPELTILTQSVLMLQGIVSGGIILAWKLISEAWVLVNNTYVAGM